MILLSAGLKDPQKQQHQPVLVTQPRVAIPVGCAVLAAPLPCARYTHTRTYTYTRAHLCNRNHRHHSPPPASPSPPLCHPYQETACSSLSQPLPCQSSVFRSTSATHSQTSPALAKGVARDSAAKEKEMRYHTRACELLQGDLSSCRQPCDAP